MGFKNFVMDQFIDVIEHVDESNKLLVYKFTRRGDEIKQGARLIVRNGQAAVFVNKGRIADVFDPGDYRLNTGNLPVLSSLAAMPTLFNSPIKSDLYFINTTQFINNRWGTKNPIIKRDAEMGVVRLTAFGKYSFRVSDAGRFMNELFGARKMNMTFEIIQYITSAVVESVAQCLGERTESILDIALHYREFSNFVTPYVNTKLEVLGLEIPEVIVENIGLPEEVEKLLDEQSGISLASKDMDQFLKYQSARAMRDAARNPGNLSGIGAGLAAGRVMGEKLSTGLSSEAGEKTAPAQPAMESILKYKKLLDQGVLTQEEFDRLKERVLNDL